MHERDGLAVVQHGAGEPIFFMPYPHGLSVVGERTVDAFLDGLADVGRTAITFDPPGAGRSTRRALLTVDEMLGCADEALAAGGIDDPLPVMGHSQGGTAALAYALERPEGVSALILVCTASGGPAFLRAPGAIWNGTHEDHRRMMATAALYWATRRRATEKLMLNQIFRTSWVDRSRFEPNRIERRDWLRPALPRTRWGIQARRLDYSGRLREIAVPTLVIAGRHDPQMPLACAQELVQGIRGAQLAVLEGSGHYPFIEEAEAFWGIVREFLSTGSVRLAHSGYTLGA